MKTLYIIGNGFDRAHSMPVCYNCFKVHLKSNKGEKPECAYCMYHDQKSCSRKECYLLSLLNTAIRDKENWSDFEEALAKIDFTILSDIYSYPKFDKLIDDFSACLQEAFHSWINNIIIPPSDCRQFKLDTSAFFVTFNYTMTLEQMYSIKSTDIYHIHCSTKGQEKDGDNYVFGHPYDKIDENIEDLKRKVPEDVWGEWCLALKNLKKDTFTIKRELRHKLKSTKLENPQIKIIGHSFGEVDFDYFDEIRKLFPHAKWIYYYHNNDALCESQNRINQFKREKGNIDISYEKLSAIMINNIQLNNQTHTVMKKEALHLQILSYLKDQKEIVNLKKVFEKFLDESQGLLVQKTVSECRGEGCFRRMSAILFAINRLQDDKQIVMAHIDGEMPENNPTGYNKPLEIGHPNIANTDGKVTGDYQNQLIEYILSPIYVSEEADDYIKRKGISKELQQAKIQTMLARWTLIIAMLTLVASIIEPCLIK